MSLVLALGTLLLASARRLTVTAAGFWVLAAATLYFLVNPALCLITGELQIYAIKVALSGGTARIRWITIVVCAGLITFFLVYSRASSDVAPPEEQPVRWIWATWAAIILPLVAAGYSLVMFRTYGADVAQHTGIQGNRFAGNVTGYEVTAHRMALLPIAILLMDRNPRRKWLGGAILLAYLLVRAFDAYDRASVVAAILAAVLLSLTSRAGHDAEQRFARTRVALGFGTVVLVAGILMWRGHRAITDVDLTHQDKSATEIVVEGNTAMLPSLYMHTWLAEKRGYDYGVRPFTRAIFAPLPRKYFPWKEEPARWLLKSNSVHMSDSFQTAQYGSKASLLGAFYGYGNIIGVVIGCVMAGLVAALLDRVVRRSTRAHVRALGVVWLSQVWIMFGSDDVWVLAQLFMTGLPAVPFFFIATEAELRRSAENAVPPLREHLGRPPMRSGGSKPPRIHPMSGP